MGDPAGPGGALTGRVLTTDEQRQLNAELLKALRSRNKGELTEAQYLTVWVSLQEAFEQPVPAERRERLAALQRKDDAP